MPIEIAALAATVVSSVLLPYIKKGAEKLAEEVGKSLGDGAAAHFKDVAGNVWEKVRSVFVADDDARVVEDFEKYHEDAAGLLKRKLQEKLGRTTLGGNAGVAGIAYGVNPPPDRPGNP